jgi:hypothetical protein
VNARRISLERDRVVLPSAALCITIPLFYQLRTRWEAFYATCIRDIGRSFQIHQSPTR